MTKHVFICHRHVLSLKRKFLEKGKNPFIYDDKNRTNYANSRFDKGAGKSEFDIQNDFLNFMEEIKNNGSEKGLKVFYLYMRWSAKKTVLKF